MHWGYLGVEVPLIQRRNDNLRQIGANNYHLVLRGRRNCCGSATRGEPLDHWRANSCFLSSTAAVRRLTAVEVHYASCCREVVIRALIGNLIAVVLRCMIV